MNKGKKKGRGRIRPPQLLLLARTAVTIPVALVTGRDRVRRWLTAVSTGSGDLFLADPVLGRVRHGLSLPPSATLPVPANRPTYQGSW